MRLIRALLVLACLSAAPSVSRADPPNDPKVAEARTLFQEGQAAYAEGRFDVAAQKMRRAYELTKSPELAYNVARTYERMGDYDASIRFFRIYLKKGKLDDAERAAVEARIES